MTFRAIALKSRIMISKTQTRSLIVETARTLFNEHGATTITTNHIARAAAISPGNLYYHFRNKEEIIRMLFRDISESFDTLWKEMDNVPSISELALILKKTYRLYYDYRFFYMEIATLIAADDVLKSDYQETRNKRFSQQRNFFSSMSSLGIIKGLESDQDIQSVLTISWIISDFWITYLFLSDTPVSPETLQSSLEMLFFLLKPYISEPSLKEFHNALKNLEI